MKIALLSVAILLLSPELTLAQYNLLYSFGTKSGDGLNPNAGLVYNKGRLFGTTQAGGAHCLNGGCGTVFAMELFYGTVVEAVIYDFCTTGNPATCPDGALPSAGLISDGLGNLYGTAQAGGLPCSDQYQACGVVFELSLVGQSWVERVLYSFSGQDGERPTGQLVMDSFGNLYGTTVYGGAYGAGTVFELSPGPGGIWTQTVLHDFNPSAGDGAEPYLSGVVLDQSGNVYGTTATSGAGTCSFDQYSGCGTAFELSPSPNGTWAETIIYRFPEKQAFPLASLTLDDEGDLLGTFFGGNDCYYNCGGVFRLHSQGTAWKDSELILNGQNGAEPFTSLSLRNGAAFGATESGGSANEGVVFKIQSGAESVLHSFTGSPSDGAYPSSGGSLLSLGDNLYGVTQSGGTSGNGTLFQISP